MREMKRLILATLLCVVSAFVWAGEMKPPEKVGVYDTSEYEYQYTEECVSLVGSALRHHFTSPSNNGIVDMALSVTRYVLYPGTEFARITFWGITLTFVKNGHGKAFQTDIFKGRADTVPTICGRVSGMLRPRTSCVSNHLTMTPKSLQLHHMI